MHNVIIDSEESYSPNIGGEHQSTFSFSRSIIDVK